MAAAPECRDSGLEHSERTPGRDRAKATDIATPRAGAART